MLFPLNIGPFIFKGILRSDDAQVGFGHFEQHLREYRKWATNVS